MRAVRKIVAFGLSAALFIGVSAAIWQRQSLSDWFVLRSYQPTADIAALARNTTMTPQAKHLFYINKPRLEGRTTFNVDCKNKTEQAAVLGCYHGDRGGIFLYAISDSRLEGVEEVTAAHEMLHQAYDRLDSTERQRIDRLLTEYSGKVTDKDVKSQIETYRKSEPNDLLNEMHSLFGSEVADLSPELETYYKQYFAHRSKVTQYYQNYQREFELRRDQVARYDKQLSQLKDQIETKQKSLESQLNALRQKKSLLENNHYGSVEEYNREVGVYNTLAQTYNQDLAMTRKLITQYNQIVEARNAIAVQERQLQQALDSRLTPVNDQ